MLAADRLLTGARLALGTWITAAVAVHSWRTRAALYALLLRCTLVLPPPPLLQFPALIKGSAAMSAMILVSLFFRDEDSAQRARKFIIIPGHFGAHAIGLLIAVALVASVSMAAVEEELCSSGATYDGWLEASARLTLHLPACGAPMDIVTKTFRRAAIKYHPDKQSAPVVLSAIDQLADVLSLRAPDAVQLTGVIQSISFETAQKALRAAKESALEAWRARRSGQQESLQEASAADGRPDDPRRGGEEGAAVDGAAASEPSAQQQAAAAPAASSAASADSEASLHFQRMRDAAEFLREPDRSEGSYQFDLGLACEAYRMVQRTRRNLGWDTWYDED